MKLSFNDPKIEIVILDNKDVICSSVDNCADGYNSGPSQDIE